MTRVWRCKVCGQPESFLLHSSDHEPEMELVGRTPDRAQEALRLIHGFMLDCNAIGLHGAAENLHKGIKSSAAKLIAPGGAVPCGGCGGEGSVMGSQPDDGRTCPTCGGTGRTIIDLDYSTGSCREIVGPCPACSEVKG